MALEPVDQVEEKRPRTFVGIGEVLFDVFEDGARTLGGAPLNVAVHAHQLASAMGVGVGVIASRVGTDAAGDQIRRMLEARGMSSAYLQTDPDHPTGRVTVRMRDGEPKYQIEAGAAWDYLESNSMLDELASRCDAICFGSLAQRSAASRHTIQGVLRRATQAVRLFDVNLRRNTMTGELGYNLAVIEESCSLATMVKLNCDELDELCGLAGLGLSLDQNEDAIRERVESVMARFKVPSVVLTLGSKGTRLFTNGASYRGHTSPEPLVNVYPVGAGDACSAGILVGTVLGWHADDSVDLANEMGAWVASQLSATPALPTDMSAKLNTRIARGKISAGARN